MNIRWNKDGSVASVKLLQAQQTHMESVQGMARTLSKVLAGERAGELAATVETALGELRDILAAEAPAKKVSK